MIVRFRVPVVNDLYSEWERELILWLIYNEGIMDRARMSATITGKTCPLKKNPKEIRPETIRLKAGRKSSVSNKDKKKAISTVRKVSNGVGVEKTWPVHSPNVEKIEVVRRGKVRRAKLNYLRDRVGKKAKVKELVR